MQVLIDAIIKNGATTVVALVSGFVIASLKKFSTVLKANSEGTKVLLKDKLNYYYHKYVESGDGTIYESDLKIACEVHNAYKGLGGNGIGDKEMEEIKKLIIKH